MFAIRPYKEEDYTLVNSWWVHSGEMPPTRDMLTPNTFFVCSEFNEPIACLSLILTDCMVWSILDNLIGSPEFHGQYRKEAVECLVKHCETVALRKGYKALLCMATKENLENRYQSMGYNPTAKGVTTLVKILEGVK